MVMKSLSEEFEPSYFVSYAHLIVRGGNERFNRSSVKWLVVPNLLGGGNKFRSFRKKFADDALEALFIWYCGISSMCCMMKNRDGTANKVTLCKPAIMTL